MNEEFEEEYNEDLYQRKMFGHIVKDDEYQKRRIEEEESRRKEEEEEIQRETEFEQRREAQRKELRARNELIKKYIQSLPELERNKLLEIIKNYYLSREAHPEDLNSEAKGLDNEERPKKERAENVYYWKSRYQKTSIIKLCYIFGVSEGYFRAERIRHKEEWDKTYQLDNDGLLFESIEAATYYPQEFKENGMYYGIDITPFKMKEENPIPSS